MRAGRRGAVRLSAAGAPPRPVETVFLDRDGTINAKAPEGDYITGPERLELLPGAAEAIRLLNEAGVRAIVVTNQRGIARGRMTEADLDAVHALLAQRLAETGAHVDAFLHCPHEEGECDCRKPRPGMLHAARRADPGIDFARAAIVGDSGSDVEAGAALGLYTVLLDADGSGGRAGAARPDRVEPSLLSAVRWLGQLPQRA